MHTDKNAMALYVRVVEAGRFSKAAAREGMPVSTVSRRIARDADRACAAIRSHLEMITRILIASDVVKKHETAAA